MTCAQWLSEHIRGKDKDEVLQEETEDEGFQEATESNMSGVKADTESDCTLLNADMSVCSSMRSLFGRLYISFYSIIIMVVTEYHTVLLFGYFSSIFFVTKMGTFTRKIGKTKSKIGKMKAK